MLRPFRIGVPKRYCVLVIAPSNTLIPDFPLAWIKPRRSAAGEDTALGKSLSAPITVTVGGVERTVPTGVDVRGVRVHSDERYPLLEDSIKRFGFTEPLLLNPDYAIVHGQLRYEVAKGMGLETVPVMLAPDTADAYVLYADRLNEWSRWNHAVTDLLFLRRDKVLTQEREELRALGWFVNDVPTHLTAPSTTLETVVREIVMNERAKIYAFKPTDLLFVEPLRIELLHFWEHESVRDEYGALAERVRGHWWDFGGLGDVGTEQELDAAIMDVLNFMAHNIRAHEEE